MNKITSNILFVLVVLYLLSPWDFFPMTLLDDFTVFGVYLFLVVYQLNRLKHARTQRHEDVRPFEPDFEEAQSSMAAEEPLTLQRAYRILGVSPATTQMDIRRTFQERMNKLQSERLQTKNRNSQERAYAQTIQIQQAYSLIKKHKKM